MSKPLHRGASLLINDEIGSPSINGIQIAEEAFMELQDLSFAYLNMAEIYASQSQFKRVVDLLEETEERFGITIDRDAADSPGWKRFFGSSTYEQWKASRAKAR